MHKKDINEALKKYYDGKSSVEEEKQLFKMLNQDDLDNEFILDKDQFNFFHQEQKETLPKGFEEKIEKLIATQKENNPPHFLSRKLQPMLSIAAVLLMAIGLSWWYNNSNKIEWQEYASAKDHQKEISLSDGSTVTLNKNSQVKYPDVFGESREVYFQGEAFFEIVPNLNKPFIINAENSIIEVLGTSFNVRNYTNEKQIIVTVVSGKVAFSSIRNGLQEKIFLLKSEQASYNKITNRIEKTIQQPNQLAWKTNKLTFDNNLMSDVIRDIEKHFDIDIEVENKAILNCHFKAEFPDYDLNTILEILEYSMDISTTIENKKYILSGDGCSNDTILE